MSNRDKSQSLFDAAILKPALVASFVKLHPRDLMKNPVMFTVELVALVATVLMVRDIVVRAPGIGFEVQIVAWLTARILEEGKSSVCLTTDMANSTSNGLYVRLGYEKIGEASMIAFE